MEPNWLTWAKKLQATAQNGLMFSRIRFAGAAYTNVALLPKSAVADIFRLSIPYNHQSFSSM